MKKTKSAMKDLMGVGIGGMAGLGVMGHMSNLPGMPVQAQGMIPIVGAGVNIAGIGATFNISKAMMDDTSKNKCKKKYKR